MQDGQPALSVQIDNERYRTKRPFYYCADCKGPVPPDLPPPAPRETPGNHRTKTMTSIFSEGQKVRMALERRLHRS